MKEIADFARLLEVDVVALHLGFVPHNPADPLYREVLAVTRDICDHCRGNRQDLHLETGQETAESLLQFLHDVERDNLFVNFDPANMILYGSGEPIAALEKVGRYVHSVHCKDGRWAARPGQEWGAEVPLGEGDVGIGEIPAHAGQDRLSRSADHRARNSAGPRAAKGRNRPCHQLARPAQGQDRLKRHGNRSVAP